MYEIYVRQAGEEGLADVEAGRTVPAEDARAARPGGALSGSSVSVAQP